MISLLFIALFWIFFSANNSFDVIDLIEKLDLSKSDKSVEDTPFKAILINATRRLNETIVKPIQFLRTLLTSLDNPDAVKKLDTVIGK